ncbi:KRI1-like family C-terminal-domain-containing protein [Panaeolus papilionaceus]|nr:KRI1-like family C-terminal-domain-containing protein [Panaeolus papilionaceus]
MAPTKQELFSDRDDDSDIGEKTTKLTINEHYAKAFQYRKEREELERLKAKYGSDCDPSASSNDEESTDSESAESEDELGEELTPAVDAAILRTLARIKKRDPAIYDSGVNIYGVQKVATKPLPNTNALAKKDKSKPVTLRQLNLQSQLSPNNSRSPSPQPLTHVQEQELLRKETIAAFHAAIPEEGGDFLIPREKTKDELEREEEEYKAFLEREVGDLRDLISVGGSDVEDEEDVGKAEGIDEEDGGDEGVGTKDRKKKKKKKKKSKAKGEDQTQPKKTKAEEDQEFLMNYILNRGWIDRAAGHVPTYNEVTSQPAPERRKKAKIKQDNKGEDEEGLDEEDTGLLSEASFDSLADHFEASYNHRFEEPDAAIIATFPRNLEGTLRRTDTTRKEARERRKARKQEELERKKEEVKRMKALKKREVKRKLGMIGLEGGLKRLQRLGEDGSDEDGDEEFEEAVRELDLEGEWDPEKHDRQMKGLFEGQEVDFDGIGGAEDEDEDVKCDEDGKPVWDDDIDIGDIPLVDDDEVDMPFGMGMDISDDGGPKANDKKDKKKKKKKKKSGDDDEGVDIDAMDADVQPTFNDDGEEEWDGTEEMRKRKLNEYMDQIYGMDFNDVVGGMPTRFKYTQVKPDALALNPVEILMATDKELNEYVGIKKYAPYRQGEDKSRYTKKRQEKLQELKTTVKGRMVKAGLVGAANGAWGAAAGGSSARASRASGAEAGEEKPKKRLGKKERMKLRAAQGGEDGEGEGEGEGEGGGDVAMVDAVVESPMKEKKEKKRKRDVDEMDVDTGSANFQRPAKSKSKKEEMQEGEKSGGGDADGAQPQKKRKRKHKGGARGAEVEA